ncbi:glycosyltransferase family 2 protein [Mesorhizobium sp. B2-4-17]|nr:glycosyltransferase family 2 protein [Mesorhizobium sp. B2-4-17]TPK92649.1 glycosyltransferase family 2 protein [Mesorhizobium sp. B2-4-17]
MLQLDIPRIQERRSKVADLAVVVPTFKEADNVAPLVDKLASALEGIQWEVVFVDDDSPDETSKVLTEMARTDPRIRFIRRMGRRGLSSAVVEGILSTSTPFIAVIDADMQHDERILPQMFELLSEDKADLVVGSRYVSDGGVGSWNLTRQRISKFATLLSQLVMKTELADPMSGFFMVSRQAFEGSVRRLSIQGYKILLDIVASSSPGLRVVELPYVFRPREHGESKLDTLVSLEFGTLLLDKLVGRWVPVRLILFGAIGSLGVVLHMSVLGSLLHFGKFAFLPAQIAATFVAMTANFFLNNILTYRDKRAKGFWSIARGLLSFYAVCSVGALANVGVANAFFASNYAWWASALAGVIVGVGWNYGASSLFTWRNR